MTTDNSHVRIDPTKCYTVREYLELVKPEFNTIPWIILRILVTSLSRQGGSPDELTGSGAEFLAAMEYANRVIPRRTETSLAKSFTAMFAAMFMARQES